MIKQAITIFLISVSFHCFALEGLLLKTIDYSFKEKWNNTAGSTTPRLSACNTVYRGQFFFIAAIACDFGIDAQGVSDAEYSVRIVKPDNSDYFFQGNLPLLKRKVSNTKDLQMSDSMLKISFEDKDSLGTYKIEMILTDKVSGKTKTISSELSLEALPPYDKFKVKDDDSFSEWFSTYYEKPNPEKALAHYIFYAHSKFSEKESSFLPMFSVILEIFRNNQFLLPQVLESFKKEDDKTKIYLIYLLHYSGIGPQDFFDKLDGGFSEAYMSIKDSPLPDPYGEITDASQLDMLWATFLASGSYKPIQKLIQTLDYKKYEGDLDKYKKSQKTDADRQKAVNNAIFNSLTWSMASNCTQHELVKAYCFWALQHEKLSETQRKELKKILNELK
ncbi:MAG: hypothetical protein ACJ75J_03835 [Cytophagaceae bacterium]